MNIDKEKCTGCRACHPYCPVAAISLAPWDKGKKSEVSQPDCVECGACLRSCVCPVDAINASDLKWPRSIRPGFSSPHAAPLPGVKGAPPPPDPKQNEVNHRISKESIAAVIEVGRPGVSTSLRDVQTVCMALAASGVAFDPGSSVTGLMVDPAAGKLQPDVLDERVMHVMIHYSCTSDRLRASIQALKEVSHRVNTVFSIGFSHLLDGADNEAADELARATGLALRSHGKTNVGLGPAGKKEVRP